MKKITHLFCSILVMAFAIKGQSQALSITNVVSTESRCSASGTLTITATGGTTPYQYAITAGPATYPNQSTNVFTALAPGTYTVRVTDNVGATASTTATVSGTYTIMAPAQTIASPYCVGGNDGRISITIPTNTGRSPYGFRITAPAAYATPVITPGSNTHTFTDLPAGSYTYQVSDSCGNVQTRTVNVNDPVYGNLAVSGNSSSPIWGFTKIACDSVDLSLATNGGKAPYTINIFLNGVNSPATTMTARYGTTGTSSGNYPGGFRVPYTNACNGTHSYTITDSCGNTFSGTFVTHFVSASVSNTPSGCTGMDLNVVTRGFKAPLTYTWVHSGGTTVQVDNPVFTNMPAGPSTLTVTDACGASCSYTTNIAARVKAVSLQSITKNADYDSTGAAQFTGMTNLNKPVIFTVLSGPAVYTSVKHNNLSVNLTYPRKDTSSPTSNAYLFKNLPVGSYRVAFVDNCGWTDTISFSISNTDLRLLNMEEIVTPGCVGDNTVKVKTSYNVLGITSSYTFQRISPSLINYTTRSIPATVDSFTYNTLSAGTYVVGYRFNTNGFPLFGEANGTPTTKRDTIVIAPYTQPAITTATQAVACTGAGTGNITVATTGGAGTFTYEIISGTATAPPQASNVFTGMPSPGTYTIRAIDACGNSNTYSVSMSPLAPPNVTADRVCGSNGQPVTLTADSVYNAAYSWTGPAGFTATGRVISIPAFTAAAGGTYTVTLSLPGCSDVSKAYHLSTCTTLPVNLTSFDARVNNCKVQLNWHAATEQNFSKYIVEYSSNGTGFTSIGQLDPQGDNSSYSLHHQPAEGKAYYRLRMIDSDGKERFSNILFIRINCSGNTVVAVYPNPTIGKVTVTGLRNKTQLRLLNAVGQVLTTIITQNTTQDIDLSRYGKAVYLLQVVDMHRNEITDVIKLVKQ